MSSKTFCTFNTLINHDCFPLNKLIIPTILQCFLWILHHHHILEIPFRSMFTVSYRHTNLCSNRNSIIDCINIDVSILGVCFGVCRDLTNVRCRVKSWQLVEFLFQDANVEILLGFSCFCFKT